MLLVGECRHHTHGHIEDLEHFPATLITACCETRKAIDCRSPRSLTVCSN
jgi:hypothetical protein